LLILQHFAEKEKGKFHHRQKIHRKFKNATGKVAVVKKSRSFPTSQDHAG
jgi:hypothetical protein